VKLELEVTVPDDVTTLDAEALDRTQFRITTQEMPDDVVPAVLLAAAEGIVRGRLLKLALAERPGITNDVAFDLAFASARLLVLDEVHHLPDSTFVI
jgi:Rad3-related DNA helicase